MSSVLFSPFALRELQLRNRIVVSPMCQYSAVGGNATDWHLIHLGTLSQSSAGLVLIEATIGNLKPVRLAFAWSEAERVPVVLGQMNFFASFDVCFFQTDGRFELTAKAE